MRKFCIGIINFGLITLVCAMGTAQATMAAKPPSTISGSVATTGGPLLVGVSSGGKPVAANAANGFFVQRSPRLNGRHTVTFISGKKRYSMQVKVPTGGMLSLKNVKLKTTTVGRRTLTTAAADEEDVQVEGTLTSVDCTTTPPTITVTTAAGDVLVVPFDPTTTEIVDDATGTVITACTDLAARAGDPVELEARVNPDGTLFAMQVTVNPNAGDPADLEFKGTIASNTCPTITVTRTDGVSVIVNIATSTEIQIGGSEDESAGTCADLTAGLAVTVEGALQPDGSVNASSVETDSQDFEADGSIDSTSCGTSPQSIGFTPDGGSSVIVTIGPATEINVNDNESAACTDLTVAPGHVEGVIQADGTVAATTIEQGSDD